MDLSHRDEGWFSEKLSYHERPAPKPAPPIPQRAPPVARPTFTPRMPPNPVQRPNQAQSPEKPERPEGDTALIAQLGILAVVALFLFMKINNP